jgi:hypothetical protein
MSADMGGTQIYSVLEHILRGKQEISAENKISYYPRQIFLLTDGNVSNTSQCVDLVRRHSQSTRIFTFGIGNEVSHTLVTEIAKASEGNFEFFNHGEDMGEKIMNN